MAVVVLLLLVLLDALQGLSWRRHDLWWSSTVPTDATVVLVDDTQGLVDLVLGSLALTLAALVAVTLDVLEALLGSRDFDLNGLWLLHDFAFDVIVAVGLHSRDYLVVVLGDLVLDLRPLQKQVLLHVLERLQPKVHVDRGDRLRPVLLWSEVQIFLHLQLMDGLPSHLSGLVLNEFTVNVEPDAKEL